MPILTESGNLARLMDANYADGLSEMVAGADAVEIASTVFDQEGAMSDPQGLSTMFVSWGQFMDHDLDLTRDNSGEFIAVPGLVAPLDRSAFDPETGITGPREQVNEVTPEIDGSQIYGSTGERLAELREFEGGRLSMSYDPTSPFGLLELATDGAEMAGNTDPENPLFLAGDVRANENTGLTVLHTLFNREHNTWAERLAADNPDWTDDQLFDAARSIVEAQIQKITYEDWLPKLIGDAANAEDAAILDPDNGAITTEFSTAGFRFGHTMVSSTLARLNEDGTSIGDLAVQDQFFNVDPIKADGIAHLLRGQLSEAAQAFDTKVIDDLNFFLTSPGGVTGFSLPALNIMRGRDHGLASWLDTRAAIIGDIDPEAVDLTDFSLVTSNIEVQADLASVYGTIDQIDLWVGGLAEDKIDGTQMGLTFTAILADQFSRTRSADETFGELLATLDPAIAEEIANTSLGDIIARNSMVEALQEDVFLSKARIGGDDDKDRLLGTEDDELILGFGGNDALRGRRGEDEIFGGDGNDWIGGGADNDILHGDDGRDHLHGHRGDDELFGGADSDRLKGGRGDDLLDGGEGNDNLRGGRGDDTFVFASGYGKDVIQDFGYGKDVLDLTGTDLTSFADLIDVSKEQRWGLVIDLGDCDKLVLKRTDLDDLNVDNILFG